MVPDELDATNPMPRMMFIAVEGAGDPRTAGTRALDEITAQWDLEQASSFFDENSFSLHEHRPLLSVHGDGPVVSFPGYQVYAGTIAPHDTEVFTVIGQEPDRRWLSIADDLLDFAVEHNIDVIVTVQGRWDMIPHTRPFDVRPVSHSYEVRDQFDAGPSDYVGWMTFLQYVAVRAFDRDINCLELYAPASVYLADLRTPKTTLALLKYIEDLTDAVLDTHDFEDDVDAWIRLVDEWVSDEANLNFTMEELEAEWDEERPDALSGEAIAHDFEQFLRRRERRNRPGRRRERGPDSNESGEDPPPSSQ